MPQLRFRLFKPHPLLGSLVKCFWSVESPPGMTPPQFCQMADGCTNVMFQIRGGFKAYSTMPAYVRFQCTTPRLLEIGEELCVFGFRLLPNAIQQLAKVSTAETTNLVLSFEDIFKKEWKDISSQIFESSTTQQRINVISKFLIGKLGGWKQDISLWTVGKIEEMHGNVDIATLQKKSGYCTRQFENKFKSYTGFAPKHYARLIRFQQAKKKYASHQFDTLAELAHACDYSDQSHFIREFKEFSGVLPSYYFKIIDKGDSESEVVKKVILASE